MAKQNSTYFSPTCFFCGKNNKRRHSRVGRTFTCQHCGEVNPGPGMMRTMVAKLGNGNGHAEKREPAAAAPAPKVAVTRIAGVAAVDTAVVAQPKPEEPKVVVAKKPKAAVAKTPPAPPVKQRGFLERVVYG